ncbi:hypothetical protein L3X38_004123 [Prunus dulcis]|uniref:Uncharacterized protein n=1 Tax=Prunus dulcis TaxID=3755 RepID=A0AAD4ZNA5_PRUDU|nr:hypothetical protein L3X38_004123 [Prunus dulcis]
MSTRGSIGEAYSLLPAHCHELERMNSGTRTYIHTDENNHFLYFFMAAGACIRGFQSSMQPIIAVDATHLKCLGDTKSIRASNWQDSGDYSQPDLQSWQTSATPSQTELQILADLGDTKSNRAANPGTHGPCVPETREANVKCTDKTEGKLDVCRHRHN